MRFLSLEVEAFQAIASAKLVFSPQLNVLFGPNDLGKSTLITALRAALLVPPKSAEAASFRSWFHDRNPRVSLTFEDGERSIWRVTKEFEGGKGSAELSHSKDGTHFTVDAKGREVEEVVRKLLSWGLEPPGGRGKTGAPDSFLVNALLAGQDQVAEIFSRSVEDDGSDSGKRALTKALAAFAQDPLFKRVLDRARSEVDRYFSETGRKRSGAKSPFSQTSAAVKQLKLELAEAQAQLDQSAGTERAVQELATSARNARAREQEATQLVERARRGLEQAKERKATQARLTQATETLRAADSSLESAATLGREVVTAQHVVTASEAALTERTTALEAARAELKAGELALQRAQTSDGAGAKVVELSTAKRRLAELGESIARIDARREKAGVAAKARADRAELGARASALAKELGTVEARVSSAKDSVTLATAILDYGRWKDAAAAAERSAKSEAEAARLSSEAKAVRAQLVELRRAHEERAARLERSGENLPSTEALTAFLELESEKKIAEAQVGGGVSVTVRPRDELRLHVEVDDEAPVDEIVKANKEKVLEAERELSIAIGQMVELEIVTGSKQARQQRDTLNKRWRTEVMPALTKAEVSSLSALQRKHAEVEKERGQLATSNAELERLTQRAEALEGRVATLTEQAVTAESAETLERRRDRIPKAQLELIAKAFEGLGADWERQADAQLARHQADHDEATRRAGVLRAELSAVTSRQEALPTIDAEPLELVEAELSRATTERASLERAIAVLERDQGTAVKTAESVVQQARAKVATQERELARVAAELEQQRQVLHEKRGRAAELQAQVARIDRAALAAAVEEAQRAWAPLAALPTISEGDLAEAERLLGQVRADADAREAEFHKAEGALSKTGGALARERVAQLEEAVAAALAKEAEVELDAKSWQLLHATLREAENTEGGHLGRALAEPVAAQFRDLTEGRYASVELGPQLRAAGVVAEGTSIDGEDVLRALSVGTRDQLASLLRLAIARQLQSALVLDDHLVHTDPGRMSWFVDALRRTALDAQVIVVTCRPQDYLPPDALGGASAVRDLAGGSLRLVDLGQVIEGWPERLNQ